MIESLKEKLEELEGRNLELKEKMSESEQEKQKLIRAQRQQIAHLVSEFDVVRKELSQVSFVLQLMVTAMRQILQTSLA